MHKYMLATLVAFALVLSSCSDSTQPTGSQQQRSGMEQKSTSSWQDYNSWIYNECCGEYVQIDAKYHLVANSDYSKVKVNLAQLVGTGMTSGTTYHGTAGARQETYEDGGYKVTEHWTLSSSDGCTFQLTIKYETGYDEYGNYVVLNYTYEVKCS
jgi:hypothetical protein